MKFLMFQADFWHSGKFIGLTEGKSLKAVVKNLGGTLNQRGRMYYPGTLGIQSVRLVPLHEVEKITSVQDLVEKTDHRFKGDL